MNFSQTQIELDMTTFAISQKCEFPVMYREMVNPSLASLRSIWVLLKLPAHHLRILFHHSLHCSTVRTSQLLCFKSQTCSAHLSSFRTRNFGSKQLNRSLGTVLPACQVRINVCCVLALLLVHRKFCPVNHGGGLSR